jgi:membrane-associated phospholipid phosphatase
MILPGVGGQAQSVTNVNVLRGLAPASALDGTDAGRTALAANLAKTGAIQSGTAHQPTLLPFPKQQQQSLRDAVITDGNAFNLVDGLGSRLGGVYRSLTSYRSADDGKTSSFTNISPAIARLIAFADATTESDATSGKYFFANRTVDGKTLVSAAAMVVFKEVKGTNDIFGKAYGLPAGSKGANAYGNSRPFQTEPRLTPITGKDFFGVPSSNIAYLRGPTQNLTDSPSYPSGHTTYGYTEALLLAVLVPQRYSQMVARAAEYGNDRIIMGAHYTMDVLGGRTLALYDLAHLLANRPNYVGVNRDGIEIDDFRMELAAARSDLAKALATGCGGTVAACARHDRSRFAHPAKNRTFYEATQTYGLPVVFKRSVTTTEDVGKLAPEAGYLLTTAFPNLTLAQADAILTATEGPGGGFLDNGSPFGIYSRLDLYKAAGKAIAVGHEAHPHKVKFSAPPRTRSAQRHQ